MAFTLEKEIVRWSMHDCAGINTCASSRIVLRIFGSIAVCPVKSIKSILM